MYKRKTPVEKKIGRPSIYTQDIADYICERIATSSSSMNTICKEIDISVYSVINWLSESHVAYRVNFSKDYALAKQLQGDYLAEELLDIADESDHDTEVGLDGKKVINHDAINRSRLRVDARKWAAAHLRPKKWGDKIDVTSDGGKVNHALSEEAILNILNKLK